MPAAIRRRGIRAKQRLMETNLRLVVMVAKRYKSAARNDEAFQDLIQVGTFGLNRAIEKFDPARGYQFSTYAFAWIRQSVGRAAANLGLPIYIPETAQRRFKELSRMVEDYETTHGHRPSIEKLQELSGLPKVVLETSLAIARVKVVRSLDQAHDGTDGDTCYLDSISDPDATLPDEYVQGQEREDLAATLLAAVDDWDRELLEELYYDSKSAQTIAAERSISRGTVGIRHAGALRRAREAAELLEAWGAVAA
jgi:RNA polymerase sigma factor (sigma-70 family)